MRWAVIVFVLTASVTASSQPARPKVAVLMSACKANHMTKAKVYIAKLPEQNRQQIIDAFCIKKGPPRW